MNCNYAPVPFLSCACYVSILLFLLWYFHPSNIWQRVVRVFKLHRLLFSPACCNFPLKLNITPLKFVVECCSLKRSSSIKQVWKRFFKRKRLRQACCSPQQACVTVLFQSASSSTEPFDVANIQSLMKLRTSCYVWLNKHKLVRLFLWSRFSACAGKQCNQLNETGT